MASAGRYSGAVIAGMDGWTAVVTGGASGIGAACTRLLEACGVRVTVLDRAADPSVDVTDRAALEAAAAALAESHGSLNVLVNAAGVLTENRPVDETPVDDLRRNLEVNLVGTFQACQAFGDAPSRGARRGRERRLPGRARLPPACSRRTRRARERSRR